MKKITAVLLLLTIMLACLCGCGGGNGVPEGMVLSSLEGEPFRLYVPEQMTTNLASGISSAYAVVPEKLIISARYYTPADETITVDNYLRDYCVEAYSSTIEGFYLESGDTAEAALLGGKDARKIRFSAKFSGIDYKCIQVSAMHEGDIISVYFYAPATSYETYLPYFEQVVKVFEFCEKAKQINDNKVDNNTPEGMKIASNDNLEYVLYVPEVWICNSESERVVAYYPESERSNVTLTSFMPTEAITVEGYIEHCKSTYEKQILGFSLVGVEDTRMSGIDGKVITFSSEYDSVRFTTRQYCVKYGELFYSLTYTARAEVFESHVADVEKMVAEFKFR